MAKVKVKLTREYKIGGVILNRELELIAPTMATMIDAASLCSPSNKIGFGVAFLSIVLEKPFNQVKALEPKLFMDLQEDLKDILPN